MTKVTEVTELKLERWRLESGGEEEKEGRKGSSVDLIWAA